MLPPEPTSTKLRLRPTALARVRRRRLGRRGRIVVSGLLLAAAQVAAEEPDCGAARGAEPVLREGHVVLLGEIHGTRQAPEFVGSLACLALARGLGVTVALELPYAEESAVREFIESGPGDGETPLARRLPFWSKDYQDGRTSGAMLELIEQARAWHRADEDIEVILLDDPRAFRQRDARMADRLLQATTGSPTRFFVALTGNLHNRKRPGSGSMGERVSAALGEGRVTSLNMTHAGGDAWICEATEGCGPLRFGSREAAPKGAVTLFAAADERGYDGTFSVGSISASPPAKDR